MVLKKTKPGNFSSAKNCIVVFAIVSIIQLISCNNPEISQPTKVSKPTETNWLTLNIKFKPGSTERIRDTCLMLIRNSLMDTMKAIKNTNPYYTPAISFISYPFEDALAFTYKITAVNYLKFRPVNLPHDTSGGMPISCTCSNGCKVCIQVTKTLQVPNSEGKNYLSDYVESITTEDF